VRTTRPEGATDIVVFSVLSASVCSGCKAGIEKGHLLRMAALAWNAHDRHRPGVLVATRLQDPLGVGSVDLVPLHIRPHLVWRQRITWCPTMLDPAPPVVRRAAGLYYHRRRRVLGDNTDVAMSTPMRVSFCTMGSFASRALAAALTRRTPAAIRSASMCQSRCQAKARRRGPRS